MVVIAPNRYRENSGQHDEAISTTHKIAMLFIAFYPLRPKNITPR